MSIASHRLVVSLLSKCDEHFRSDAVGDDHAVVRDPPAIGAEVFAHKNRATSSEKRWQIGISGIDGDDGTPGKHGEPVGGQSDHRRTDVDATVGRCSRKVLQRQRMREATGSTAQLENTASVGEVAMPEKDLDRRRLVEFLLVLPGAKALEKNASLVLS